MPYTYPKSSSSLSLSSVAFVSKSFIVSLNNILTWSNWYQNYYLHVVKSIIVKTPQFVFFFNTSFYHWMTCSRTRQTRQETLLGLWSTLLQPRISSQLICLWNIDILSILCSEPPAPTRTMEPTCPHVRTGQNFHFTRPTNKHNVHCT